MKTTELIEKLNNIARTITAKVSDNKIIIVNTADIGWGKLASFPMFIISTRATEVSDGTSYAANWMGLNLVNIGRIFNLLEEYVTTSQEDREDTPLYYVKLPSGHYMRNFYESPCAVPTIEWTTSIGLARAYTKHELKELNELYWTLAIPAFPDFLKNNEEEKN